MATIGSLYAMLKLNSRQFEAGLSRSHQKLKGFGGAVSTLRAGLGRLTPVLAGVGGATGLLMMANRTAKNIDATAKLADKLGLTTEALIGLRHAAELTGVETTKLEMGLQRMTRRVSEAAMGAGEAQGALRELGLSAAELNRLSPDRQFSAIADAMDRVRNQSDRVRLAFKLFDSEGVSLVNTLRGGSRSLKAFADEAERLGMTFSREEASQVENYNDALTRLKGTLDGIKQSAVIALATPQVRGNLEDSTFEAFMAKPISTVGSAAVSAFQDMFGLLDAGQQQLERGTGPSEVWIRMQERMQQQAEQTAPAVQEMAAQADKVASSFDRGSDALDAWVADAKSIYEETRTPLERYQADVDKLNQLFDANLLSYNTFSRGVAASYDRYKAATFEASAPGSAEQITRAYTALGAVGGKAGQRVPITGDPQQTALLADIARSLSEGVEARAA